MVMVVLTFDLPDWWICNRVCLCVRKWKIAACAPCSLMAHPVTPCRLHVTAAQWLLFLALSPAQRPAAATLPPPLTRLLSPRKTASLVNDDQKHQVRLGFGGNDLRSWWAGWTLVSWFDAFFFFFKRQVCLDAYWLNFWCKNVMWAEINIEEWVQFLVQFSLVQSLSSRLLSFPDPEVVFASYSCCLRLDVFCICVHIICSSVTS